MTTYRAPIRDMKFVIDELAGLENLAALPGYEEVNSELAAAVLEEAA
jgi:3-(methylthio)propanoyl-CoA dehydrogenase